MWDERESVINFVSHKDTQLDQGKQNLGGGEWNKKNK